MKCQNVTLTPVRNLISGKNLIKRNTSGEKAKLSLLFGKLSTPFLFFLSEKGRRLVYEKRPCLAHHTTHLMATCSEAALAGTYSLRAHQMESSGHIHKTSEGYSGSEQVSLEETPQKYELVSWKCNILIMFNGKGSQQSRKWPLLVAEL